MAKASFNERTLEYDDVEDEETAGHCERAHPYDEMVALKMTDSECNVSEESEGSEDDETVVLLLVNGACDLFDQDSDEHAIELAEYFGDLRVVKQVGAGHGHYCGGFDRHDRHGGSDLRSDDSDHGFGYLQLSEQLVSPELCWRW
jgi:hypothetical protein